PCPRIAPGLASATTSLRVWLHRRRGYGCTARPIAGLSSARCAPAHGCPCRHECTTSHSCGRTSESRARVSGMRGQRSPLLVPAACADSRPDESERCVRRGHAPETARLLLSARCQPCVTDAAALP